MKLACRRGTTRRVAAALVTGLVVAGATATAAPAVAGENQRPGTGGATATLDGRAVGGDITITVADRAKGGEEDRGTRVTVKGGLFSLSGDGGGALKAYGVDVGTGPVDGAPYRETSWESSTLHGNPDAARIRWILRHSYPMKDDLNALAAAAGVASLTEEEAAAGTQAAIWTYSDGVEATPVDTDARGLAEWLVGHARTGIPEPGASLELTPSQVAGKPGKRVGPITVNTHDGASAFITLDATAAAEGITLVDGTGELITPEHPVIDGAKLYFDVPADAADGTAALTAEATTQVPVGRVLTGVDTRTQTMVLAASSDSTVFAHASATWAAKGPSPSVTAEETCAAGGVRVTASNAGNETFVFELAGERHEVAAGGERSVVVAARDGQAYEITVDNPLSGAEPWVFAGVLDCSGGDDTASFEANQPGRASGDSVGGDRPHGGKSTDLATTGSRSNTPLIAGIAVVLIVIGGVMIFVLRQKAAPAGDAAPDTHADSSDADPAADAGKDADPDPDAVNDADAGKGDETGGADTADGDR